MFNWGDFIAYTSRKMPTSKPKVSHPVSPSTLPLSIPVVVPTPTAPISPKIYFWSDKPGRHYPWNDPWVKLNAIRSRDKARILAELKSTKVGSLVGYSGIFYPWLWPATAPTYVAFRAMGRSREDAANETWKLGWKICSAVLIVAPIPGSRIIGIPMASLSKPVDMLSDKELGQLKQLATDISSDPDARRQVLATGTGVALAVASKGSIDSDQIVKMAQNITTKMSVKDQNTLIQTKSLPVSQLKALQK
jgi:hypothetical protein